MSSNEHESNEELPLSQITPNDTLCKLFVGNINKTSTDVDVKAYFEAFGNMKDINLMKDNINVNQNRGFAFVTPETVEVADKILLQQTHNFDGRDLDIKRALPKDINDPLLHVKTTRIFLGGLPHNLSEQEITDFFNQKYSDIGIVKEVVIKKERQTGRPRGFCFVSFDNPHVVDKIMIEMRFPVINNKRCEVKKADPGIPITGVPPSQIPKYSPHPSSDYSQKMGGFGRGQINPSNHMGAPSYDYSGYPTANPNIVAYPQSNAYYSYYQNQASMNSQYQHAMPNQAGYGAPYGYAEQRNVRPTFQRPPNTDQTNNRTRPY